MMLAKSSTLKSSFPSQNQHSESNTNRLTMESAACPTVAKETHQHDDNAGVSASLKSAVSCSTSTSDSSKAAQLEAIRIMQQYLQPSTRRNSSDTNISSTPMVHTAGTTSRSTKHTALESSIFATAEILKQNLLSENADDQLLHQILFATLDRSKPTSSPNLNETTESPSDDVIAMKKSYLDLLHQQIARSSGNVSSNNGTEDSSMFSSMAWKPIFQSNHQDIDYSANIFASSAVTTVTPVEVPEEWPLPQKSSTVIVSDDALVLPPATSGAETLLIAAELAKVTTDSSNAAASQQGSMRNTKMNTRRSVAKGHNERGDQNSDTTVTASVAKVQEKTTPQDVCLVRDSEITDNDVLLGRGGRTNHHDGNKRYLQYKLLLQEQYFRANKEGKTKLSQQLVQMVHDQKGRFLKQAEPELLEQLCHSFREYDHTQLWYEVDVITARKKASQTLREHSTPEFRAAKRAKYSR